MRPGPPPAPASARCGHRLRNRSSATSCQQQRTLHRETGVAHTAWLGSRSFSLRAGFQAIRGVVLLGGARPPQSQAHEGPCEPPQSQAGPRLRRVWGRGRKARSCGDEGGRQRAVNSLGAPPHTCRLGAGRKSPLVGGQEQREQRWPRAGGPAQETLNEKGAGGRKARGPHRAHARCRAGSPGPFKTPRLPLTEPPK